MEAERDTTWTVTSARCGMRRWVKQDSDDSLKAAHWSAAAVRWDP